MLSLISSSNRRYVHSLSKTLSHSLFQFHPEVKEALISKKPVVALESTIISHGMPYPQNLETAKELENIIRNEGCVPCTMGLVNGKIQVGLHSSQLELLANPKSEVTKVSQRDIAYVLSKKCLGATTVSSTMWIAKKAGIKVFVTGGIGGVHRGVEESMDISADLTALGNTKIAVVCAGVKSILDIGKTLEYLETLGVPVCTLGETDNFPGFFVQDSGFKSPFHFTQIEDCARFISNQFQVDLNSGLLVGVPIPKEYEALSIQKMVNAIVMEARKKSIVGKKVTPYILGRLHEVTKGSSLKSNIALVKNNAKVGAQLARMCNSMVDNPLLSPMNSSFKLYNEKKPVIIGGSVYDITSSILPSLVSKRKSSFPGKVTFHVGGVGRNVAEAVHRLQMQPVFLSVVGDDTPGDMLIRYHEELKMDTSMMFRLKHRTAIYNAFHCDKGDLDVAVADMSIFDHFPQSKIIKLLENIDTTVVALDGNLPVPLIEKIVLLSKTRGLDVFYEPTSIPKARKLCQSKIILDSAAIKFAFPNEYELEAMYSELFDSPKLLKKSNIERFHNVEDSLLKQLCLMGMEVSRFIPFLFVKAGPKGVLVIHRSTERKVSKGKEKGFYVENVFFKHYPAKKIEREDCVSVTGAGDSFAGVVIAGVVKLGIQKELLRDNEVLDVLVQAGMKGSQLALSSHSAISQNLNSSIFTDFEQILEKKRELLE